MFKHYYLCCFFLMLVCWLGVISPSNCCLCDKALKLLNAEFPTEAKLITAIFPLHIGSWMHCGRKCLTGIKPIIQRCTTKHAPSREKTKFTIAHDNGAPEHQVNDSFISKVFFFLSSQSNLTLNFLKWKTKNDWGLIQSRPFSVASERAAGLRRHFYSYFGL